MNGGIALVRNGAVVASVCLPVAGLMSLDEAQVVAERLALVQKAAREFAVPEGIDPVMTLSFAALCVIPALKLNTRGLFDVTKFSFVPVDAGV